MNPNKSGPPPEAGREPWRDDQLSSLEDAIDQAEDGELVDNDEACGWLEGFIVQYGD